MIDISPAENELFTKALQLLLNRSAEKHGCEGDPVAARITPEEVSRPA